MLPLPGLSPASGKPILIKFDGDLLSSEGGVLTLREVETRPHVAAPLRAHVLVTQSSEWAGLEGGGFRRLRGLIFDGRPTMKGEINNCFLGRQTETIPRAPTPNKCDNVRRALQGPRPRRRARDGGCAGHRRCVKAGLIEI